MGELRVIHYLNQFFGQLGGEEQAQLGPRRVDGPVGCGRLLAEQLGPGYRIVATLICGDDYRSDAVAERAAELVALARPLHPDLIVAGPAFAAGRYSIACAAFCQAAGRQLGVPTVASMSDQSPGADLYRQQLVLARCGEHARDMVPALANLARVAIKVREQGAEALRLGTDPILPRGLRLNTLADASAAVRAVDMLSARVHGRPFRSEVPLPTFAPCQAARPLPDLAAARIALITTGGVVPVGNPERLKSQAADRYGHLALAGLTDLSSATFVANHGGYFNDYVNADPDRMVPLDVMAGMARSGLIGGLHDQVLTLAGTSTHPEVARDLARQMAAELAAAGVGGVLLTSA